VCSEHRAGPTGEEGTRGWVRGLGCSQGCQADRDFLPELKGATNVPVLVKLESVMCACTSDLLPLPAQGGGGPLLSALVFM